MREELIENRLYTKIKQKGGIPMKCIAPNVSGMPDRAALLKGGKTVYIELKAPGKTPNPLQVYRIAQLRDMGFQVYVINSMESVDMFIKEVFGE